MNGTSKEENGETTVHVRMPLTHWVTVGALVVAIIGTWTQQTFKQNQLEIEVRVFKEDMKEASAARQSLIDSHRTILDNLSRIAERMAIKLEHSESDLADIKTRLRTVENRVERMDARSAKALDPH